MTPPSAPSVLPNQPNLLQGDLVTTPAPLFVGAQRTAALNLLGSSIVEGQLMSVMKLLRKDPSLCLEDVPVKTVQRGASGTHNEAFAKACLDHGMSAGYVFAVARGFDPSKLLMPALSKMAARAESAVEDMSLLLSMGADVNSAAGTENEMGAFATAMLLAYPAQKGRHDARLITMMLDAGAKPVYHQRFDCPYGILVATGGWDDPVKDASHSTTCPCQA